MARAQRFSDLEVALFAQFHREFTFQFFNVSIVYCLLIILFGCRSICSIKKKVHFHSVVGQGLSVLI